MGHRNGNCPDAVIEILKPMNFPGGLEFSILTYTVTKHEQIDGDWVKEDVLMYYLEFVNPVIVLFPFLDQIYVLLNNFKINFWNLMSLDSS